MRFLLRTSIVTVIIIVIAEGVEYWRGVYFPSQQWFIVPLIMFFTALAIIANIWLSMKQYKINK